MSKKETIRSVIKTETRIHVIPAGWSAPDEFDLDLRITRTHTQRDMFGCFSTYSSWTTTATCKYGSESFGRLLCWLTAENRTFGRLSGIKISGDLALLRRAAWPRLGLSNTNKVLVGEKAG